MVTMLRQLDATVLFSVMNFGVTAAVSVALPFKGRWQLCIASNDHEWGGEGQDAPRTVHEKINVVSAKGYYAYETVKRLS